MIVGRDVDGPAFPLFDETVVLGRERGDILFPEDGYVSGTHAQLTLRDGQVYLSDLGSSNGTFFRIRGSRSVASGQPAADGPAAVPRHVTGSRRRYATARRVPALPLPRWRYFGGGGVVLVGAVPPVPLPAPGLSLKKALADVVAGAGSDVAEAAAGS